MILSEREDSGDGTARPAARKWNCSLEAMLSVEFFCLHGMLPFASLFEDFEAWTCLNIQRQQQMDFFGTPFRRECRKTMSLWELCPRQWKQCESESKVCQIALFSSRLPTASELVSCTAFLCCFILLFCFLVRFWHCLPSPQMFGQEIFEPRSELQWEIVSITSESERKQPLLFYSKCSNIKTFSIFNS